MCHYVGNQFYSVEKSVLIVFIRCHCVPSKQKHTPHTAVTLAFSVLASRHCDLEPKSRKSNLAMISTFARPMIVADLINFFLSQSFSLLSLTLKKINGIPFRSFNFNNSMRLKRTFIESKLTSLYL